MVYLSEKTGKSIFEEVRRANKAWEAAVEDDPGASRSIDVVLL
jgi:hypothetical protein